MKFTNLLLTTIVALILPSNGKALSSGDVSVKCISGYFWLDNSCTAGGPQGKVVSFRVINTKGTLLQGVSFELTGLTFVATGGTSYSSGTPSFNNRTSSTFYIGDIAAGDSATAFFFVGYNCLVYPNNTNITTDYLTLSTRVSDALSGTVSNSFNRMIYVLRNSNNNTINILATSTNTIGTITTLSVAYSISNVKPSNIIDMELSTTSTFPAGYSIMGCKITASTITTDFPVNMLNTHYSNSIQSNLPSGGTVTIEWYLKISQTTTGINSSNIVPFIVSDAGSAQRWQANTTTFTGTGTPTNPLTMTKRASRLNNLVDDTVVYTIVIRNSSTTSDVTIDKLVDKLPRDYQYRYMETNLGVFPRLVTYSNTTSYPLFQDTNYLFFYGTKQISAGVYSWVIPAQDSIKLIYSIKVSSNVGLNDTNFIYAYVGSSQVASAFSKVNVLASLPVELVKLDAVKQGNFASVSCILSDVETGSKIELFRKTFHNDEYLKVDELLVLETKPISEYVFNDLIDDLSGEIGYMVKIVCPEGKESSYYTNLSDLGNTVSLRYNILNSNLNVSIPGVINAQIVVNLIDASGKTIYSGTVSIRDGRGVIPFDVTFLSSQIYFLNAEYKGRKLSVAVPRI